jgi:hypothetical protein
MCRRQSLRGGRRQSLRFGGQKSADVEITAPQVRATAPCGLYREPFLRRGAGCGVACALAAQAQQSGINVPPGALLIDSHGSGGFLDLRSAFGADQLGPNAVPVIGAEVPAPYGKATRRLEVCASRDRNTSNAPVRNGLNRVPKARRKGRNAAADIGSAFNLINHRPNTKQNVCLSQQPVIDLGAKFAI